jgi:hypothetical protein
MSMRTDQGTGAASQLAASLIALGTTVPKPLAAALSLHAEALGFEVPTVDAAAVYQKIKKPGEIGDLIRRMNAASAERRETADNRAEVIDLAARHVLREVVAAGPGIIAELGPTFDQAAAAFTEIYATLPRDFDLSALVAAGGSTVDAFNQAHALTDTLRAMAAVRNSLAATFRVAAAGDAEVEAGTRYCEVRNTGTARRAAAALKSSGPLAPWGALLQVDGVSRLRWLSIAQHTSYLRSLTVAEGEWVHDDADGFGGRRFVEA